MKILRPVRSLLLVSLFAGLGGLGFATRATWLPWLVREPSSATDAPDEDGKPPTKIIVSEQAQKNLGLTAKPIQPTVYWKTIAIPGAVVDRPGFSDRGIPSPVSAIVTSIHHVPGDVVRPDEPLFALRVLSESLQLTQTDLFKSKQELALAQEKLKRLGKLEALGVESQNTLQEAQSQVRRFAVAIKAYRQELLNRGFSPDQIDAVAEGTFVRDMTIVVPPRTMPQEPAGTEPVYEVQDLKVELGQQVSAGQTLCLLANHRSLAIEGRAFRDETRLLERSVNDAWPVDVDFGEHGDAGWPALDQTFRIHHIANSIDPTTGTFAFLVPLENQVRTVERDGRSQLLWRFRPGQKLRLLVRVEKLDNVFVVPADAIAQDGADVFVFTQNVNTFERQGVHLLLRDGRSAVLANDGSLELGSFVAQSAASQLNRMTKAGSRGVPRGYHIHADGSLHKNEDEGK